MKQVALVTAMGLALAMLAAAPRAQDQAGTAMTLRPVVQTPEWQKLRSLVGRWDGSIEEDGKKMPATVEVRMTADGSALMHVLGKDTPHEMVTMFHPDGTRLLATHYCAAHNQPRMALVPSGAPNKMAFTFVDGTNIGPGETYMKGVVFTFVDADHHEEAWTSSGSPTAAVFKYTRKK